MSELDDLFAQVSERSAAERSRHLADVHDRADVLAVRRHRRRSVAGAVVIVVVVSVLGVVTRASPARERTLEVGSDPGSSVHGPATPGTGPATPGTGTGPVNRVVDPPPADLLPSSVHVVPVRALGTAVEIPGHPLQLCFMARLDAPQDPVCDGMPLTGRLDGLPPLEPAGTHEGVRSTGIVTVTARYDGSSLTSTAPIVPGIDPATDRDYPSYSACPPPPGGWAPARRGSPSAAEDLARSLPGYENSRLVGPLGPSPMSYPVTRDVGPDGSLLLVTFVDHAAENETRLREAYDGPLCVMTAPGTTDERGGGILAAGLCRDLPSLRCSSVATTAEGHLQLRLVYGDQRLAAWLADRYPDSHNEVVSYLHPLS
jgi:hypothetical protein